MVPAELGANRSGFLQIPEIDLDSMSLNGAGFALSKESSTFSVSGMTRCTVRWWQVMKWLNLHCEPQAKLSQSAVVALSGRNKSCHQPS